MVICDHKAVHEDFKFLGNESEIYLLGLKKVYSLKEISQHLYSQELLLF